MDAPDLQSILANLARYYTTSAQPLQPPAPLYNTDYSSTPALETWKTTQAPVRTATPEMSFHADLGTADAQTRHLPDRTEDPRLKLQSRATTTASPKAMIDPATITTWRDAVRCVQKISEQNKQFADSIRKMIEAQRRHENRWHSERLELKHTQAKRATSSAAAQSILQSLSGNASASAAEVVDREAENEAELAAFDRKIYAAQVSMESAMIAELKSLGVPFFGTDQSLIVPDGEEVAADQSSEGQPKWSPKITESRFLELRREMVKYLEDLYKD